VKIGNRLAPPRFLLFLAVLPLAFFAYRAAFAADSMPDSGAMAFDAAAWVFLLSLLPLTRDAEAPTLRAHAAANDAGRWGVLVLTTLIGVAVLAAIGGELDGARQGQAEAIVKLVATLLTIWIFANIVFALHYAHVYYLPDGTGGDAGGLAFPETATPTYGDFAYFAFTLGMTFQTSDVAITATRLRHAVLLHSVGAFVFNIGVIAFAINVIGG